MNQEILKKRFKDFALRIMKLVRALPKTIEGKAVGNQIFRSGTSSVANYRAACRARSKKDFIAKLGIVEEELDETMFWLEMIMESNMMKRQLLTPLFDEANELLSITIKSKVTARKNNQK